MIFLGFGLAGLSALLFGIHRHGESLRQLAAASNRATDAQERAACEARMRELRRNREARADVLLPPCPPGGGNASLAGGCYP